MVLNLNPILYLLAVLFPTFIHVVLGSCNEFSLGLGSGSIPDNKITASSVQSASTPAKNGRLNYTAGSAWCANTRGPNPYLQVDLETLYIICAVSTQGNSKADQWVKTYTLQSSTDGSNWTDYNEAGQVKTFEGNNDRNSEVKQVLFEGVLAKYLRFVPKSYHNSVCMRAEIFGVRLKTENLAFGKPAAQSSTVASGFGAAGNAVDGNSDTEYGHGHCSSTKQSSNTTWWRVDLGPNRVPVSEVSIVNRFSTHFFIRQFSEDYKITVGDNPDVTSNPQCIGLYSFIQFKASAVCFTNPLTSGRYLGIVTKKRIASPLTLCEVEVYSRGNLAFGKRTTQIGTASGHVSSKAVDGNSNTSLGRGLSCTLTTRTIKPWWRVDLERVEPVSELYIVNRGDCCGSRLDNFEIRVGQMSSDGGIANPRCGGSYSVRQGEGASFHCRPYLYGRYVTIKSLRERVPLTLCEVEVYSARRACYIQAIGAANSNTIPDDSFSASSSRGSETPSKGRLNGPGAWSPFNDNNADDYLQIDLQYEFFICAVATQGKQTADHRTTMYKLLSSLNKQDWVTYQENNTDKIFNGNSGRNDIVKHNLKEIISARFIRFQPIDFSKRKALRIEVFGVLKPAVPSQPPRAFTVVMKNTTCIKASWQLPPADFRHGIIQGFKLFYKKRDVGKTITLTIIGEAIRSKYVTGLEMYTEYELRVLAFTSAGDGPKSYVKVVRTMGDALEWSKQKPSSPAFAPNLLQGGVTAKITLPPFPGNVRFYQVIVLRLSPNYNGVVKSTGNFTPEDLTTYEDAHASPIPAAYVTFQFGENNFNKYQEFVVGNGTLSKNIVKRSSEKEYHNRPLQPTTNYRVFLRAFVTESVYISTDFVKIDTKDPPIIIEDVFPTSVICKKQTLCLLYCRAISDIPISYSWTKDGQNLVNEHIRVMNNTIIVKPRTAEDYGIYVCKATNSFGVTPYEITLIKGNKLSAAPATDRKDDDLSKINGAITIALSGVVFVLLVVIGLLACRLRLARLHKTSTTTEGNISDVNEHETPDHGTPPSDQHVPEGDVYAELHPCHLAEQPNTTSEYQSLQEANTSSVYYNVGFAQPNASEGKSRTSSKGQSNGSSSYYNVGLAKSNASQAQPRAYSKGQSIGSSAYYNAGFAKPKPMEGQSQATSKKGTKESTAYYNMGFISGSNKQDCEVYYEIGNTQC